jgi:hypothetical protein
MSAVTKTDDDLMRISDDPGFWQSQDGVSDSLRRALLRAAEVSGAGRSPYPIHGAGGVIIEREQMVRLWHRHGIKPASRPTA